MSNLPSHAIAESIGHEDRGTTIVTVGALDVSGDEVGIPLVDLIEYLTSTLAKIPAKFRSTAMLHIKGYGDYVSLDSGISYQRPETDAELADRRRWLASINAESEARDRAQFARLKEKYGRETT